MQVPNKFNSLDEIRDYLIKNRVKAKIKPLKEGSSIEEIIKKINEICLLINKNIV